MNGESTINQELLQFFKALADPNRLKIVGLLAQEPRTGEQLAAMLGVSESTVSHHMARLTEAGLASAVAQSYYSVYSLRIEGLAATARRLLSESELPKLANDVDLAAFDRKVLATFTDDQGRITQFPVQQSKFLVLLRHAVKAFEPERRNSEKEVNQVLSQFNDDTARLRRGFVEHGLMAREGGGGAYWRIDA